MYLHHLIQRLEDLYSGQPWYGESITSKINSFTSETAFVQPAFGVHSIAELVAHMIAWRKATIEWLQGNREFTLELNSADDWPLYNHLQQVGWDALKSQLADSQNQLLSLLRGKTDEILSLTYSTKPYTFQYLLEGIIQHDIYHLGQIALIAKIVSSQT